MTIAIIILFVIVIVEFLAIIAYTSNASRLEDKLEYLKRECRDNHSLNKEADNDLLKLVKQLAETQGYTVQVKRGIEINPFAPLFRKCPVKHIEELSLEKVVKLKVGGSKPKAKSRKAKR